MARDLFNTEVRDTMLSRVNKLTASSKGEWGKMNVSQMLAHCSEGLKSAKGDIKLPRTFLGFVFGKMAKKSLTGEKPFKKNLPTDKNFIVKIDKNFDEEKTKLIQLINSFSCAGAEGVSKDNHPFFGKMSADEWNKLMYNHLDHHLKQFGV